MTAAHCILENLVVIRLGAYDITSNNEGGSVDFGIEWKKTHESYDPQFITNDIAMIKLSGMTNITNLIRPICIPLVADLMNRDWTGTLGWVAGKML